MCEERKEALLLNVVFTFSVKVTLLLRSVEKPDEQSVSVGELGHECVSLCCPSPPPPPASASLAAAEVEDGLASSSLPSALPPPLSQLKILLLPVTSQPTTSEEAIRLSLEF